MQPLPRKRGFKHFFLAGKLLVDDETGCWIWCGAQTKDGYGSVHIKHKGRWRKVTAQRYFFLLYRYDPDSLDVSHNCHRRLCCNPKHMRADTHWGNCQDWKHYRLTPLQENQISALMGAGYPCSFVADKLMLPRLVVWRAVREIDWRSQLLLFDQDDAGQLTG